jgi:transcriptional regulator with XRE-family HTH domain
MGAFIRHQRELANMSLRQLSQATQVSNAYLSQIERGLHDPTLRVLIQIGAALQLSIEDMLREGVGRESEQAEPSGSGGVEAAVRADPQLGADEKEALIAVYRSFLKPHVVVADATGP